MVDLIVFADDSAESKVAQDMIPFFEAVVEEIARHVPEKGYGYRNGEWLAFFKSQGSVLASKYAWLDDNPGEALDATAMIGFAWLHENGKMTQEYTGER